jgi:hypothetical protein
MKDMKAREGMHISKRNGTSQFQAQFNLTFCKKKSLDNDVLISFCTLQIRTPQDGQTVYSSSFVYYIPLGSSSGKAHLPTS